MGFHMSSNTWNIVVDLYFIDENNGGESQKSWNGRMDTVKLKILKFTGVTIYSITAIGYLSLAIVTIGFKNNFG